MLATLQQYPLWFLQGVAAFPRRRDAAPGLVYVVVGLATLAVITAGVAVASRRLRLVMAVTATVAVAVPFVLTVTTIEATGPIWQGRYGAPYHVGLVLLAGLALDTTTRSRSAHCPPSYPWAWRWWWLTPPRWSTSSRGRPGRAVRRDRRLVRSRRRGWRRRWS